MKPQRLILLLGALLALLLLPVASAHAQGGDEELARISEATGMVASYSATSPSCEYSARYGVYLCAPADVAVPPVANPAARARVMAILQGGGTVLMVPDSTNDRVMTFDPQDGTLIDADFIPSNSVVGTGVNAILNAEGDGILISDQIGDVVHEFTLAGAYVGIFAPAGGPNTAILDNIRGISLRNGTNLLVTVGGGANQNSVAEFDSTGAYLSNFVAAGSGGLDSPFDVYGRAADWLVAAIDSDAIHRYDLTGAPLPNFAAISTFPEQVTEAANGNVLVANFSGSTSEGIYEFLPDGTFVARYDPVGLGGYRGVWELGNGNLLVTTGAGVHEINRANELVETEIAGLSGRFIEPLTLGGDPTPTPTTVPPTATATATTVPPTATATALPPTATATSVPPTATVVPPTPTGPPTSIELGTVGSGDSGTSGAGWLIALLGLALVAVGLVRRRR